MTLRPQSERGATMVEAGIAMPVVTLLIFLIFQSAFAARTWLAADDAASSGARAAAVAADADGGDFDILRAVDRSLSSSARSNLVSIVVFKPEGSGFDVPSGCATAAVPGKCNRYLAADLVRPQSAFGSAGTFSGDDAWPNASRNTDLQTGLTRVGIYVQLRVGGIPSILPNSVSKNAVVMVEPHS